MARLTSCGAISRQSRRHSGRLLLAPKCVIMGHWRVNCRAKIRRAGILPAARVHLNRHGAISRAFDTLLNSISLTPDPAHRRRTFCLDGWISTWKCIFGPFCARLVPSFGSWNLRRCSVCRRQRRRASSLCGSTRRRRLRVTAAARCRRIVEVLARRRRCIWRMLCRRSLSQRPGFASWRSGGMTWLQGTGDDSAVDRALGCLQARPCGSWADATDHCFGAAAAKPCPLRCGAGPRPSRDLVAAADGRLLQRPQRPQRTGEAGSVACCFSPSRVAVGVTTWTALAMCLLPMEPGCRGLTAAARQKVQKEAEGNPSHCIKRSLSSQRVLSQVTGWAFSCHPWRACPITPGRKRGLREGQSRSEADRWCLPIALAPHSSRNMRHSLLTYGTRPNPIAESHASTASKQPPGSPSGMAIPAPQLQIIPSTGSARFADLNDTLYVRTVPSNPTPSSSSQPCQLNLRPGAS